MGTEADRSGWALLGGLRFALATIVVGAHLVWFSPNSHLTKLAYFSAIAAVLGFLMVSGYSIAHSLAQSETGFYRRRLRRIMPLYVLALCLGFAIGRMPGFEQWGGFAKPGFDQLICNFFFLQLLTGESLTTDVAVWTLAVEVVFYLLAPLIRKTPASVLLGCIAISASAFILYNRLMHTHFAFLGYGWNLLLFAWPWLLGFYLYAHKSRSIAHAAAFAIPLLTCALSGSGYIEEGWPFTVTVSAACIMYGSNFSLPAKLSGLLNILGGVSYPLYLIHLPSLIVLHGVVGIQSGVWLIVCCVAIAWMLDKALEVFAGLRIGNQTAHKPIRSAAGG